MALILHLTDLHLGPRGGDIHTADQKVKVIPQAEIERRINHTESLLDRLSDRLDGKRLNSIVVSGDITFANGIEGYDKLEKLFKKMVTIAPVDSKAIIIVPGNHDVKWGTRASSPERYENFVNFVRAGLNVTTPFLEGVDKIEDFSSSSSKSYFVDIEGGYAVIPINSANYCGSNISIDGVSSGDLQLFFDEAQKISNGDEIVRSLKRLIQFDIARISPDQMAAFRLMVKEAKRQLSATTRYPVIIATLHHHLLPVAQDEEIKPFEGFTNLGAVRALLKDVGVNIVMHGHKHREQIYWDRHEIVGQSPSEFLVVSGASVGGEGYNPQAPFRLIEINQSEGGAHRVSVRNPVDFIEKRPAQFRASLLRTSWYPKLDERGPQTAFKASDFNAAYELVLSLPIIDDEQALPLNNLFVTIEEGNSVQAAAPELYPSDVVDNPNKIDEWFNDIAEWWQSDLSELPPDRYFTHGSRIKGSNGSVNQLDYARAALEKNDIRNGRAVLTLVDPESDLHLDNKKKRAGWFPAFAFAQIYVTSRDGKSYWNIVGYYRKQEMRYWWPINVRELRLLLESVRAGVKNVHIGTISTLATIAVAERGRPRVAVPLLDRWYDLDKGKIADLVSSAVNAFGRHSDPRNSESQRALWHQVLTDLVPPTISNVEQMNSVPLSTKGVDLAYQMLRSLSKDVDNAQLTAFSEAFERISSNCRLIDGLTPTHPQAEKTYDALRTKVEHDADIALESILKAISDV